MNLPSQTLAPPWRAGGRYLVVGIGGAGAGAALRLRDAAPRGLRFLAVDTSAQALAQARRRAPDEAGTAPLETFLLAGGEGGGGSGGRAELADAAASEAAGGLLAAMGAAEVVFLVAGLAGGTGGGAGPRIAALLRAAGRLVIGFGILPFGFESERRRRQAAAALDRLRAACDTTLALDNDRLLALGLLPAGQMVNLDIALRVGDDMIRQAAAGLVGLTEGGAWLPVDMPLARSLLAGGGDACVALGLGRGPQPAGRAMRAALASPLTDMGSLKRATAVLAQVSGGSALALHDTSDALAILQAVLPAGCAVTAGVGLDPTLGEGAQVMLIGLGLPEPAVGRLAPQRRRANVTLLPRQLCLDPERGAYLLEAPLRQVG